MRHRFILLVAYLLVAAGVALAIVFWPTGDGETTQASIRSTKVATTLSTPDDNTGDTTLPSNEEDDGGNTTFAPDDGDGDDGKTTRTPRGAGVWTWNWWMILITVMIAMGFGVGAVLVFYNLYRKKREDAEPEDKTSIYKKAKAPLQVLNKRSYPVSFALSLTFTAILFLIGRFYKTENFEDGKVKYKRAEFEGDVYTQNNFDYLEYENIVSTAQIISIVLAVLLILGLLFHATRRRSKYSLPLLVNVMFLSVVFPPYVMAAVKGTTDIKSLDILNWNAAQDELALMALFLLILILDLYYDRWTILRLPAVVILLVLHIRAFLLLVKVNFVTDGKWLAPVILSGLIVFTLLLLLFMYMINSVESFVFSKVSDEEDRKRDYMPVDEYMEKIKSNFSEFEGIELGNDLMEKIKKHVTDPVNGYIEEGKVLRHKREKILKKIEEIVNDHRNDEHRNEIEVEV